MRSLALLLLLLPLAASEARAGCEPDPGGDPVVELQTTEGTLCVGLYPEAPGFTKTVENFLGYLERGDYDGTFFHRSVPGFVIQGGGFAYAEGEYRALCEGDCPTVDNEFDGVSDLLGCGPPAPLQPRPGCNVRGTLAMAKTSDPDSATSQWFINLSDDNRFLDEEINGAFTVFGRVTSGMVVADAVAGLPVIDGEFAIRTPLRSIFSELPVRSALPPSCFDLDDVAVVLGRGSCTNAVFEPDPVLGGFLYFVSPPCFEGATSCEGEAATPLDVCEIFRSVDGRLFFRGTPPFASSCEEREASDRAQSVLEGEVPDRLVVISRAFVVPEPGASFSALAALLALAGLTRRAAR